MLSNEELKLRDRLESLLSESLDSVLLREQNTLEEKIGSFDAPFILFGAGNLGKKVFQTLKKIGKSPVAFIDNNSELWGSSIFNTPIMSPHDAAIEFDPENTGIIVTIWCGEATDKMSDRVKPLKELGFKNIALFGHLAWRFKQNFLPHYCLDSPSKVIADLESIKKAYSLLSDFDSQKLFVDHVEWRLSLDYDLLPAPSIHEIYFNKYFTNICSKEVLYDIGAYIGDSIDSYLNTERGSDFSAIYSFEPATNNFLSLNQLVEAVPDHQKSKIFPFKLALSNTEGSIQIEENNGPASRVGTGSEKVEMTTIDSFSQQYDAIPTFIKIDIEGFEPACLEGAQQIIQKYHPVIAVCVYHIQDHLWTILLQINSYYPRYHFYLCPHLADGWDLVLYAVPEHRLPI